MDPWLSHLQRDFSVGGRIRWRRNEHGLILAEIDAPEAGARLSLHGGQLLHWAPKGASPMLWCSPRARLRPGQAIRGGIPVCWPWFGSHPRRPDFPAHGFARTALWQPLVARANGGGVILTLALVRDAASFRFMPQRVEARLTLHIGRCLRLTLESRNPDCRPVRLSQALHAYFAVSHPQQVRLLGLDGRPYVDKVAGGRRAVQRGPVVIRGETDRVFLQAPGPVILEDPGLGRRLHIHKTGSGSTVVWNPGAAKSAAMGDMGPEAWKGMLCIEAANALDDSRTLLPGERHRLAMGCWLED